MSKTYSSETLLKRFRIYQDLYLLGTFETGLTIYDQQIRALNLVWSMVEGLPAKKLGNVAVVGGGFAGLTAAAGLIHKGVRHVSVFERRASLCPLQLGSDTRWVHPRIYDWPSEGSALPTAGLPFLNWHAGRASDVAVEILRAWEEIVKSAAEKVEVYTNVKHLRVGKSSEVEWVGETISLDQNAIPAGAKKTFDSVILAVGFGREFDSPFSYWRNDPLGQPELDLGKRTYLVSGHGDGALVDLFRIRISRFRQDRILVDLFTDNSVLLRALEKMKLKHDAHPMKPRELYEEFERLAQNPNSGFKNFVKSLRARLRADTAAVLQMSPSVDSFKNLFESPSSFQNRFLVFALFRAGGLIPTSNTNSDSICEEYGIQKDDVIRRHGTDRKQAVKDVLDKSLVRSCSKRIAALAKRSAQPSRVCWIGGYWHESSPKLPRVSLPEDKDKARWRQEHLPPATEVFVTGFVAGVAGYLAATGAVGDDFRVTLHRTLYIGPEVTLQQSAQYCGKTKRLGLAARTFAFNHGTMGYAAAKRKIVRTRLVTNNESKIEYAKDLQGDMAMLNLTVHSQPMAPSVRSVLALPILTLDSQHTLAVLYADSTRFNAFGDRCVATIREMCSWFASRIEEVRSDRVRNFPVTKPSKFPGVSSKLGSNLKIVETIEVPSAPVATNAAYLNVEFTDFVVAGKD
jgi:FAD dependent oxidoreductase